MNSQDYKVQRKQRGTQEQVAALLGVSRVTIARRETGEQVITREAQLALLSLRKKRKSCGFTMVEIAICLAIIGIALVAIIGVLPIGMNTQRDNREETIINQDATILMEAIRGGARNLDDLTNYVYAITNIWTNILAATAGTNGYTSSDFLTNGANIVGLLSTPEFTDPASGAPIPNLIFGGVKNHIVAYVRSISGPAVEKPPQTNSVIVNDSFSYRVLCVNTPIAVALPPIWQAQPYTNWSQVYLNYMVWQVQIPGNDPPPRYALAGDVPGQSDVWVAQPYTSMLTANLRELGLTFLWPKLPNGNFGSRRQTFRTQVAGKILQMTNSGQWLYFYQPQSFAAPAN